MKSEFEFKLSRSSVKKFLAIVLAVVLCIGMLPSTALAEETVADDLETQQTEEISSYDDFEAVTETSVANVPTLESDETEALENEAAEGESTIAETEVTEPTIAETEVSEPQSEEVQITETSEAPSEETTSEEITKAEAEATVPETSKALNEETSKAEPKTTVPETTEPETMTEVEADKLEAGKTITATLTTDKDTTISIPVDATQYYKFTATKAGNYKFTITESAYNSSSHGLTLSLLNSSYGTIKEFGGSYSWGGKGTFNTVYTFKAGETCYISATATGTNFAGTITVKNIGDYDYSINYDNTIQVTKYYGSASKVTIPSTIDGYKVNGIGNGAFQGNTTITSVVIPDGVISVKAYAFYGCTNLTSVSFPDSIKYIFGYAFSGCTSLASVTLPDSLYSIYNYAFSGCTSLASVTLPDSLNSIYNYAFYDTGLTSITIPKKVSYIGHPMVKSNVVIKGYSPSYAKTYAENNGYTFESVGSLENSVLSLDTPTSISVKKSYMNYYKFVPSTTGAYRFIVKESASHGSEEYSANVSILNDQLSSITGYQKSIYSNMIYLTLTVKLEAGKTYYASFQPSTADFKGTIEVSAANDFAYEIDRQKSTATLVAYFGSDADLVIPAYAEEGIAVTAISDSFICEDDEAITSLVIPEGVTSIGSYAFSGCSNLASVQLPSTLKSIGYDAFYNCGKLSSVTFPDGLRSIGYWAFYGTGLTSVDIPKNVIEIGTYALGIEWDSVNYGYRVKDGFTIKGYEPSVAKGYADTNGITFEKLGDNDTTAINVSEKTSVSLAKTTVNYYTFAPSADGKYRIEALENAENSQIGHSVEVRVYNSTFTRCLGSFQQEAGVGYNTGSVSGNGSSVTGNGVGNGTSGTSMRLDVPVAAKMTGGETYYIVVLVDGDTFNGTLEAYPTSDYNYLVDLQDGTTTITGYTGSETAISIPSAVDGHTVTGIGYDAFAGKSITSATIPSTVSNIYPSAFYNCYNLASVTLPEGLKKIHNYAFYLTGLKSLTIPSSVIYLGTYSVGYTYNYSKGGYTVVDDFVIIGSSGSMAEQYASSNKITFKSTTPSVADATVTLSYTKCTYSGSAMKPTVTVKYGTSTLKSGKDYTVAYKNNINVGTATVTVTGIGSYTGTIKKTFKIVAASLSAATVSLSTTSYTYTGASKKPTPTVKLGKKTLVKDTDYTVTYKDNINAGTATVIITGTKNYTGTAKKTFKINAYSFSKKATVTLSTTSYTYTGAAKKPTPTVKLGKKTLTKGKDYTVAYKNNTNAGTATVTITGIKNYSGTVKTTFKIKAYSISKKAKVTLSKTKYKYTGSAIKPTVTVKIGKKTLVKGKDYTVTYSNNKKKGKATVTVKGIGNYSGYKKTYFTIK